MNLLGKWELMVGTVASLPVDVLPKPPEVGGGQGDPLGDRMGQVAAPTSLAVLLPSPPLPSVLG